MPRMNHRRDRGHTNGVVDDLLELATLQTRIFKLAEFNGHGLAGLVGLAGLTVDPELEAQTEVAVGGLDEALLELWAARDGETEVHQALAEWKASVA